MTSKILFATPTDLRCEALGPMSLSAVLKRAGHEVTTVERLGEKFDYVLYSMVAGDSPPLFEDMREIHPDALHIAGGPLVTYSDESVTPPWVIEFRGPAEDMLAKFVELGPGILRGTRFKCPYPDIIALPWPDRELFPQFTKHPMKRFITARGCPWRCSHCFNSKEHKLYEKGERMQRRSVDDVIEEVLSVKFHYGLELAYFNDDDFARDDAWLLEFCDRWPVEVGLPFIGSVRAESITAQAAYRLGQAGCTWMNMALESAVTSTLKLLRRPPNQNDVYRAVHDLQRYGVQVRLQNMIGLPVADPLEDAWQTLQFNQAIGPDDSWCSIYQPLPGTDLFDYCLKNCYITADVKPGSFASGTELHFTGEPYGWVAERIDRLQRWWHLAARGKWSKELLDVVLELDIDDKRMQELRWKEGAAQLYGGLV